MENQRNAGTFRCHVWLLEDILQKDPKWKREPLRLFHDGGFGGLLWTFLRDPDGLKPFRESVWQCWVLRANTSKSCQHVSRFKAATQLHSQIHTCDILWELLSSFPQGKQKHVQQQEASRPRICGHFIAEILSFHGFHLCDLRCPWFDDVPCWVLPKLVSYSYAKKKDTHQAWLEINFTISIKFHHWLVVVYPPLWKIWVRQLGWLATQYMGK